MSNGAEALLRLFYASGPWLLLRAENDRDEGRERRLWVREGQGRPVRDRLDTLVEIGSQVLASPGRAGEGFREVGAACFFHARCQTPKARDALDRFPVPPSIIVEAGATRFGLWVLRKPLRHEWVLKANLRLAHRLHGVHKAADLDRLWVPVPGTCLLGARKRLVTAPVASFKAYEPKEVVGFLRDPEPRSVGAPV